nr:hypothetical protein GCM10020092_001490 [Actinoplanes digitatis]
MVGHAAVDRLDRGQLALGDQVGQQLGVVHDLDLQAELLVLVAEGVEAVRAGRHDPLDVRFLEGLHVLLCQHLEDELVADTAGRVARTGLALAQDGEVDAGLVQQRRDRPGGLLGPVLERVGAAHPEEIVEVGLADPLDLEVEALGPVLAGVLRRAPGVALVLQVAQHDARPRPGSSTR